MSRYFLLIFCMMQLAASGQPDTADNIRRHRRDSIKAYYLKKRDSLQQVLRQTDTDMIRQSFQRNVEYFQQIQKENRDRKRKQAIRYIILGVSMLTVLVIGLSRRRKKEG